MEATHPDRESVRRILERRKQSSLARFRPPVPCHKCGANCWESDVPGGWYCFRCGNLGYVRAGESPAFVQQSDLRNFGPDHDEAPGQSEPPDEAV